MDNLEESSIVHSLTFSFVSRVLVLFGDLVPRPQRQPPWTVWCLLIWAPPGSWDLLFVHCWLQDPCQEAAWGRLREDNGTNAGRAPCPLSFDQGPVVPSCVLCYLGYRHGLLPSAAGLAALGAPQASPALARQLPASGHLRLAHTTLLAARSASGVVGSSHLLIPCNSTYSSLSVVQLLVSGWRSFLM